MADVRVYIPFDDGSAVSYDGREFVLHKCPVGIDADLYTLSSGTAERIWRERRGELVKVLEAAWWRQEMRRREKERRKIYRAL